MMIQYESQFQYIRPKDNELMHHGVKGMKWGVRRYQNPDGSLTAEGKNATKRQLAKAYQGQLRADRDKNYARSQRRSAQANRALASLERNKKRFKRYHENQAKQHERSAYNREQIAKTYDKLSTNNSPLKGTGFKQFLERNGAVNQTKIKNISNGKETTIGRQKTKLYAMLAAATAMQAGAMYLQYKS